MFATASARSLILSVLLLPPMAVTAPVFAGQISPHRATYALSLDGSKAAKQVDSAKGEIVYELRGNPCAGYSVQLRQTTDLLTDKGRLNSSITTASWEDGEGATYRFRVVSAAGDEPMEEADGVAERRDGQIMVKATKPEEDTFSIGKSALFPTQHVLKVLTAAAQGESLVEAPVYDGSPDARKVFDTLTVIGRGTNDPTGLEAPATSGDLAGRTRYPLVISYYERGTDGQTPDYTISFDLFDNGVSRALKLDYGDFALRGVLTSYEALPQEACAK